jgi:hypothetical protein
MNAFILLLLTQFGVDSRIAYGATAGSLSRGDADHANQQALRELEATTKSVMVRPRSEIARQGFVQPAGGFSVVQEFAAMPGPQPVSYEVAQATYNNQFENTGAVKQGAAATKEEATKKAPTKAGATGASDTKAPEGTATGAGGAARTGEETAGPPRTLPEASGNAPSAIRGPRSAPPPAAIDAEDERSRAGIGAAGTGGRTGATGTEADPSSDVDRESRAAASASIALLESSLTPAKDAPLSGRAISLAEVLGRGSSHEQKFEIAELYWRLALAIANLNWAVDESKQLEALPAGQGAIDAPLLTTARAAAQARMLEAKALAVAAQQELADAIGQPTQTLPLTVEQPLVGHYRTLFDRIFATRTPPPRTRAIDRTLPLRRQAIDVRTAAVQAAVSAVRAAEEAHAQGKADVSSVLTAHQDLARQRREFLRAVGEYNADIVAYAAAVANPGTSNTVLVSMLTRSKSTRLSDADAGGKTFAGRNQPTLADPALDPDYEVQPAAAAEESSNNQDGWFGVDRSRVTTGASKSGRDAESRDGEPRDNISREPGAGQLQPIESETGAKE